MAKNRRSATVDARELARSAAPRTWPAAAALNSETGELVRRYVPLVGGQLKRLLASRGRRVSRNHWHDLFQEGCLGLISAALRFDPAAGIPFAVFALPRVHSAMRKALLKVETRQATSSEFSLRAAAAPCAETPLSMQTDLREAAAEQMQQQVERAVHQAAQQVDERWRRRMKKFRDHRRRRPIFARGRAKPPLKGSSPALLHDLLAARLLISDPAYRLSLRRIGRLAGVTYARVFAYARELRRTAGQLLAADPAIRARLRAGHLARIDAELRRDPLPGAYGRVSKEVKAARKKLRQSRYMARRKMRAAADPGVQIRKKQRKIKRKEAFRQM